MSISLPRSVSRPASAGVHGLPLIDLLKVFAAQCIVWHHFALYGPMGSALAQRAESVSEVLVDMALWVVQIFLVVGGFLAARGSLPAPGVHRPISASELWILGWARWRRLAVPALVALLAAVLAAALARWLGDDPDTPAAPTLAQVLAHVFFLQDLVGLPALSSGVWYLAIDLQLQWGLLALLLLRDRLPQRWRRLATAAAVVGAVALSLLVWNLDPDLDAWALYFVGAWGLGVLSAWARGARSPAVAWVWWGWIVLLGLLALWVEPRERVGLAVITALLLAGPWQDAMARLCWPRVLTELSRSSYALFLVHYPVALVVGAMVDRLWPGAVVPALWALGLAWGLSMLAAQALHLGVELRWASPAKSRERVAVAQTALVHGAVPGPR